MPLSKRALNTGNGKVYQYLDLSYIRQVSDGDEAFEKEIIQLFIEHIPKDLTLLAKHFEAGDCEQLKQTLHYMQPNISIIGLDIRLRAELEKIETADTFSEQLYAPVSTIADLCNLARAEAIDFLKTRP